MIETRRSVRQFRALRCFFAATLGLLVFAGLCACGDDYPVDNGGGKANVRFMPDTLPSGQVGQPYRAELMLAGGSTPVCQVVVDTLPAGLTLTHRSSESVALISGTPIHAGTCTFTVTARCFGTNISGDIGERTYAVAVRHAVAVR